MANYELGNLVWKITGDTKNFDQGVKKADTGIGKLTGGLKKLGFVAAAAFTVKKLVEFGSKAIGLASDLEESQNAVNVVFEDGAEILEEFGRNSVKSVGLTQAAFNELATSTGALLKQTGLAIDDVANRTVELSKRAADTASIFNVEVSDAMGAFNAALRGEAEPARRFGVNLSEAAVQAEALASGLVTSKDQINDQIKVQARYNILMKQTSDFTGDFANTQESFSNQLKISKANISELGTAIGTALLPSASNFLNQAINPLLEGLTKWINRIVITNRANKLLKEGLDNLTDSELENVIQGQRIQLDYLNDKLKEQTRLLKENEGGNRAQQARANAAKVIIAEVTEEIESETKALAESTAQLEKNKAGREEYNATLDTSNTIGAESVDIINSQIEANEEQLESIDALIDKTEEYSLTLNDLAINTLGAFSSIFSALNALQTAQANNAIANIDRQLQAQLEAAGLAEQSTIERLQSELEAAMLSGDTELAEEKRRELERTKLIEEAEKKKAQIQYRASLSSWGLQKAIGIASGAQAILSGFATQPFIPAGLAAGALATTLTGLQVAAIDAAKPQRPSFQSGGLVPQPPGVSTVGDRVGINVNPGEMILTRGQQQNLFNRLNDNGSVGGGGLTIIQNNTLNTDSFEGLQKAAQQLFPALEAEGVRRG